LDENIFWQSGSALHLTLQQKGGVSKISKVKGLKGKNGYGLNH